MSPDLQAQHTLEYETMAQKLGVAALLARLSVSRQRIQDALAAGDVHLNTIPLESWDRMAGMSPWNSPHSWRGKDWPMNELRATARHLPWSALPGLSLAQRVCVLKHVAKNHL